MRLIDADALKSKMDGYWGRCQRIRKPRNGETAVFLDIKAIVEAQPTVDAVPLEWIIRRIEGLNIQAENSTDDNKWAEFAREAFALEKIVKFWAERKEE